MIEDAGSRSGVVVNGRRIKMHPLKPGDTIVIGSTEFLVHL
jgi:pSer/pThr/pTyr-binding forkhead associated (FHA) protein